jgi:hypothetical protein
MPNRWLKEENGNQFLELGKVIISVIEILAKVKETDWKERKKENKR